MDVAVKVRHPNVEEQIGIDFIIMKSIARIIDNTPGLEWLKLSETMSQFSATIASQTDLGVEGRHLYLFNHYFRNWKGVSFPKPIILTQSILVESFEVGDSVDKYSRTISCRGNFASQIKKITKESSHVKKEKKKVVDSKDLQDKLKQCDLAHFIVTTGQDTYLKMLLQDNLMHADLHPGNILIQQSYPMRNNIDKSVMDKEMKVLIDESPIEIDKKALLVAKMPSHKNPSSKFTNSRNLNDNKNQNMDSISTKIVLVDAGMVARLVPDEQMNFIGLLEAMGEGRGDEAAEHVMRFSNNQNYDHDTKTKFRKDMKELFDQDCRGYGFDVNIGVALRGVLNLVRIHKITIDANYATLVMNCLCLDSMAHNLLPSYNILDGAKPLLRFNKFLKKVPGTPSCFFRYYFYFNYSSFIMYIVSIFSIKKSDINIMTSPFGNFIHIIINLLLSMKSGRGSKINSLMYFIGQIVFVMFYEDPIC